MKTYLLVVLGLLLCAESVSAQTGSIVGRIVDQEGAAPLVGAQVFIAGTEIGTLSGLDGRYRLTGVPAGTVDVSVQTLGYGPKTVTGVTVSDGGATQLDISLSMSALEIEGITVTAEAERGSVAGALNAQRTSNAVVNAVTSEEISRSPDGDAAAAIRRVNGVTLQDDKYVVVRGLGERYTTTTLNGVRLPSPEPERRVVPLDIFPSGLLQSITVSKTFTPDQSGDFSGGQVDIRTREFPGRTVFSFSTSTTLDQNVIGNTILANPSTDLDFLAAGASDRSIPEIAGFFGNFQPPPGQAEMNEIVRSFRNVWSPESNSGTPGGSFSGSLGGTTPAFGSDLGFLASFTYSNSPSRRKELRRAQAIAQGGEEATEVDRFEGESGSRSVSLGGLLNLGFTLDESNRLRFDGTFSRSADTEGRFESGFSENLGQGFDIQRLSYVERTMYSGQFGGDHQLSRRQKLDWTLSASSVERDEPDRSEILFQQRIDPITGETLAPAWFSVSNDGAVRTFSTVEETAFEAQLNYRFDFGPRGRAHAIQVGGLTRTTDRDADNVAFSIAASLPTEERVKSPEEIFAGDFFDPGDNAFRVIALSQGGSYFADDQLWAGYAMIEYQLTDRLHFVGGARLEHSELDLEAISTLGDTVPTNPDYTDLLPSAALKFELSDRQNLRVSASRTLARPEYRELANLQFRDVLGGDNFRGNPDLKRALIQNYDVRWEFYPSPTESFSVALFAKNFDDPIEQIFLATSGTRIISFENAESAKNYGVELEARKRLDFLGRAFRPFTFAANVLVMESEIEINSEASSQTNSKRDMVGQSPWAVNAGLTYRDSNDRGSATLLYNVSGRRIVSAAEAPLPDVFEEERHLLDLSLRLNLTRTIGSKLDLENLLDAPYKTVQGDVVREFYKVGRSVTVGLNWRP